MTIYDQNFSKYYGFWRPYVQQLICRFLDFWHQYAIDCSFNPNIKRETKCPARLMNAI